MQFLSNDGYHKKVKNLFLNDKRLDIAVAFWGKDSESFFENTTKRIRIICNLDSGACNPHIINKIKDITNVTIRNNSHLHAKVLIQNDVAIIGSANLSANGLSFEGHELDGWIEAGILSTDKEVLTAASEWFKNLWKNSEEIDEQMLNLALKRWRDKRNQRELTHHIDPLFSKSFLLGAMRYKESFKDRNIYFVIYKTQLSQEAMSALEKSKKSLPDELQTAALEKSRAAHPRWRKDVACYEGWDDLPDDAYLIDIYHDHRNAPKVNGIFYTPREPICFSFKYNNGSPGTIKLCNKRKKICERYKITNKDKEIINQYGKFLWEYNKDGNYIAKVIPFIEGLKIIKKHYKESVGFHGGH